MSHFLEGDTASNPIHLDNEEGEGEELEVEELEKEEEEEEEEKEEEKEAQEQGTKRAREPSQRAAPKDEKGSKKETCIACCSSFDKGDAAAIC